MKRVLGPIVIIAALAFSGMLPSAIEQARAAAAPANPPAAANAGPVNLQPQVYGPVDQSKALDFGDQPASVPHAYVAGKTYNVQILKNYDYAGILNQMNYYAQALGVQCQYCHVLTNFAYDTAQKRIARRMQLMVANVNNDWVSPVKHDYPHYAVTGAVGCATCHRGRAVFPVQYNVVPVQFLNYTHKTTKQAGYVVNSMYAVTRSLGVNCLFCHNTADFLSLQYYPTNRIAHRMWTMVDDINHRYLPANIPAVTCYTCHQGAKWPEALVKDALDQTPVDAVALHPEVHGNPGAHLEAGGPH
jgi:hypothetical protein